MDKLKALYESYINGGILSSETTFEQFSTASSEIQESLYKQGLDNKILSDQTDLSMFKSAWSLKKKDVSTLETEDTDGTSTGTGDPTLLGSSTPEDGKPKGEVVIDKDSLYLEKDFNLLNELETATESNLSPGASARARMMRQKGRDADPKLKKKILSDYNISSALKMGIIDNELIESALVGNKNSIKKIQELSVKTPKQYAQEIADKDLNNPVPFEGESDLVEIIESKDDKIKKVNLKTRIKEYDKETSRLLDQTTNPSNEELEAIYERPSDPNYYSEDEALSLEDEEAVPKTGFEDSYIHEMYNTNDLKGIENFNIKNLRMSKILTYRVTWISTNRC